ncbi:ferrochelatase [Pseudenhygromyxa sp. WMMC2535]|uniref:ferrochelatase n=1 Tax=Pseudenhygromyxa sp. WMMC2535 TaxID=2712867 RepID=UPI001552C934|nr:ferrochelatase [Pseudenhygromyxa sp. WMMC2535]NVB38926.1 ferrochelatase [Pseudenhygromyxa sp. WMMC2535]
MTAALHRTGVLLVNLGTPDAPEPGPVRRYLREFLSDPRVIDINPVGRWLLLELIILPTRPRKSAAAYRQIWTAEGSPLLVHGRALRAAVAERFPEHPVALAMRYGSPSIRAGLESLRAEGCDRVVVLPLYPHYASSSTGSTIEKVYAEAGRLWNTPYITVLPAFYDHPAFIDAFAAVSRPTLAELEPDHVLFSFHGVPERQVLRSADPTICLASAGCCERLSAGNRNCYRAQCYETARLLAAALGLGEGEGEDQAEGPSWSVSFQSRLGRTPWIKPYTDEQLGELARRGRERVAVLCPAFVADCLETIEEIGMRAREDYSAHGKQLRLVPSLNAHPAWVDAVELLIREGLGTPKQLPSA